MGEGDSWWDLATHSSQKRQSAQKCLMGCSLSFSKVTGIKESKRFICSVLSLLWKQSQSHKISVLEGDFEIIASYPHFMYMRKLEHMWWVGCSFIWQPVSFSSSKLIPFSPETNLLNQLPSPNSCSTPRRDFCPIAGCVLFVSAVYILMSYFPC